MQIYSMKRLDVYNIAINMSYRCDIRKNRRGLNTSPLFTSPFNSSPFLLPPLYFPSSLLPLLNTSPIPPTYFKKYPFVSNSNAILIFCIIRTWRIPKHSGWQRNVSFFLYYYLFLYSYVSLLFHDSQYSRCFTLIQFSFLKTFFDRISKTHDD